MDLRSVRRVQTVGLACVLASMACDGTPGDEPRSAGDPSGAISQAGKVDPAVIETLARGQSADVIVLMKDDVIQKWTHALTIDDDGATDAFLTWRANAYDELKQRVWARVPAGGAPLATFRHLPVSFARLSGADAIAALASDPEVERIVPDERYHLLRASTQIPLETPTTATAQAGSDLILINQPQTAQAGKIGAGTSVAVIDTGVDYTRTAFGCTAPGAPASCAVAFAKDFTPVDDRARDDNGHGTNVAGIVLSVAPATKILALDVFDGPYAWSSAILSAIDWTIANRTKFKIAALNMSLGGGSSSIPCASSVFASSVASARTAGIVPAIASGNNGFTKAIAQPGCVPAAVSVGAVYDRNIGGVGYGVCDDQATAADKVTCFSNSASFLTLLAPGVMITAAGITMTGTSQATPHVAGAAAVLRAAFPSASVDTLVQKMAASGTKVTDARNGVITPRLDLFAAAATADATGTIPPVGTVTLNAGARYTTSAQVTAKLTVTKGTAGQVCISNTSTCIAWTTYVASTAWTLSGGDGVKTVSVWFKTADGTVSTKAATATITLDTIAPTDGTVSATATATTVVWSWSGFADKGSGLARYALMVSDVSTPVSCNTTTSTFHGTGTKVTKTMPAKKTYYFRLCALDNAGNMSGGATAKITLTSGSSTSQPAGSDWAKIASGTTEWLWGVWGSGPNDVWAVGDSGTILRWNGSVWAKVTSGTTEWLWGIWGSGPNDVWAAGGNGTILRWNGSAWAKIPSGTTEGLYGIWGSGPNDVWIVGWNGTILRWNGSAWAQVSSGTTSGLVAVWGSGPSDVWAVGTGGTILRWNGSAWAKFSSGATEWLNSVWGSGPSDVWAVGSQGVWHWNGTAWALSFDSSARGFPVAVWGSGPSDVSAVGFDWDAAYNDTGSILRWNGSNWAQSTTGSTEWLWGVWGSGPNDVWAVGESGTILRRQ